MNLNPPINHDNQQDRVTTAVLLAAGTGRRLQPLTGEMPKCLTEVNGHPILERLIHTLRQHGFRRLIVVVGHLERSIRDFLAEQSNGLDVHYVVNPQYRTTNNIYSLWLARKAVQEPFLLVECDLIFEPALLANMLYPDRIAVSHMLPWMSGATVTLDHLNRVTTFHAGTSKLPRKLRYKTVNIYSLSLPSWHRTLDRLGRYISDGNVNEYYEAVFADMVTEGELALEAVLFDAQGWYEIDTREDLIQAERMFAGTRADGSLSPIFPHGIRGWAFGSQH